MASFTHIYFDFFGTLVQYSAGHRGESHDRSHHLLSHHGCDIPYEAYVSEWEATFEGFVQTSSASLDEFSMDELVRHFLNAVLPSRPDASVLSEFRDTYLDEWSEGVSFIPELASMLDTLASQHHLAVVSNTHHEPLVCGLLEKAGIATFFSDVITSVVHGRRKPCPTIYHHTLSITGGAAGTGLFVGDSLVDDYEGPRAVGLQSFLIDSGGKEPIPDEHRLRDILELRERIGP